MQIPGKSWVGIRKIFPVFYVPANSSILVELMETVFINDYNFDIRVRPVTISHYIRCFSLLPDLVLQSANIQLCERDDSNLVEMLNIYRQIYKAATLWIIRKHDNLIDNRIYEENFVHYEVIARQKLELLKLIQNIFDKHRYTLLMDAISNTENVQGNLKLGEEGLIWFSCEFLTLKQVFEKNGILGKALVDGRRARCDRNIKMYSDEINTYYGNSFELTNIHTTPLLRTDDNTYINGEGLIKMFARTLSKIDDDFFEDVYLKYLKAQKKIYNELRNTSGGCMFYLDENGQIVNIEKHKRGKGRGKNDDC